MQRVCWGFLFVIDFYYYIRYVMDINTSLWTVDNIICTAQNSFAIQFNVYKNVNKEPLLLDGYIFSMAARRIGTFGILYDLSDYLSVQGNVLTLSIPADKFTSTDDLEYEIRETWQDNYNSFTILRGNFTIKNSFLKPNNLATSGNIPVIQTIDIIQTIFYQGTAAIYQLNPTTSLNANTLLYGN